MSTGVRSGAGGGGSVFFAGGEAGGVAGSRFSGAVFSAVGGLTGGFVSGVVLGGGSLAGGWAVEACSVSFREGGSTTVGFPPCALLGTVGAEFRPTM